MRFLWIIMSLLASPALANDQPFGLWLEQFRKDAAAQGISEATLSAAFAETKPIDRIIELDRKQPEGTKTLPEYLEGAISSTRIEQGREMIAQYKDLLEKIEEKYGVDKEVIVALWGIETNYGENTGNFSVIDSLATLAYDGRRSDFFRAELINALKIVDDDHITVEEMSGSWAGAMGQCQFMPTSFLKYAVDENGDGKRDIWGTPADIFGSIAHYLQSEGWVRGQPLAMPISLPEGFDMSLADIAKTRPIREWKHKGVTYNDGSPLSDDGNEVSVILVGRDADAVPYMVYSNFKVILKWNRSRYFATAVDMLSEEIH